MSSQKEQLSPEERQKRLQEEHYAKQVAVRDAQLAKLRQQAKQAAKRKSPATRRDVTTRE
ncbi:hypothetical protein FOTG_19208 [Fusarium oxysporum f. sp. vasinfectum 25433]|uniref:Uncharacterized protein n=1 Tax=Fusarium oxysporum f. sp. vasinfectum 25433 TaxID=1089449 RepID=X0LUW8_FUSOX|nr:hypothetical protein FOTG_19208 [Fusarium oxysporum f. sp. vasinfectum 25433]